MSIPGSPKQIHQGEPSNCPSPVSIVTRYKILQGLQMLQANLRVKGATDLLSIIYNLVHQILHNS